MRKEIVYGGIKLLIKRDETDLQRTIYNHKSTIGFKYKSKDKNNVDELENEVQESLNDIQSLIVKQGDEFVKLIKALPINDALKNRIKKMINKAPERHQESSKGTYAQFIKDQEENKEADRSPQL